MENRELKRVFDQVKLSPERQEAMLERLLSGERSGKTVKPMKKMVAVLVAAALMLMACAFTVATGLDQRILEYFGGTEEDAKLLAPGFMAVDLTSTAENGAKVHISQVYSDRRSVVVVGEITVPDGTVLNMDNYRFEDWNLRPRGTDGSEPDGGYGSSTIYGGGVIWNDEAPGDNTMSFLQEYHYEVENRDPNIANKLTWATEIECFELTLGNLKGCTEGGEWSTAPVLVPGEWTFEIPLSGKDFGWTVEPEQSIELEGETVQVEEIYLSPVGLSVRLTHENGNLMTLVKAWEAQENGGDPWGYSVVLRDQNGRAIEGSVPYSGYSPYTGQMLLNFDEIYDPAQFQGGTVTILGQTFSLDNLQPVTE